ncbi:MAG: hypothetical protein IJZ52_06685 [Clostridium sp.]|nr:hypothetical protein [Clostridium sp.]
MRNQIILPGLAVCGGAAGFAVRKWLWLSAYDPASELFAKGSPAVMALGGFLLVMAAVLFLLSKKAAPDHPGCVPPTCPDPLYMCLMASGAFVFFGAGVLGLLEGMDQLQLWRSGMAMVLSYPAALLLCGGLCLVSGVCVLAVGKSAYRPGSGDKAGLFAVIPPFTMLVWLFATHQAHATDPVFLRYGVYLTAAALLMLAHYDAAAFYQGHRHTHRFLFCSLMGSVLALTSLADGLSLFQMAMAAACTLSALGQCYALLSPATEPEH